MEKNLIDNKFYGTWGEISREINYNSILDYYYAQACDYNGDYVVSVANYSNHGIIGASWEEAMSCAGTLDTFLAPTIGIFIASLIKVVKEYISNGWDISEELINALDYLKATIRGV